MTITTYREGERLSYNWDLGTDYHFPDGTWRPYREARRGGYSRFECQSGRLRQEVQFSSAGGRTWFRLIQPIRREGLYIETDIPRESGLYRRQ